VAVYPQIPAGLNRFNITRFNTPINFKAKALAARRMRARIMHKVAQLAEYHVKEVNFPAEAFVDRPSQRWPKKRASYGGPTLVKTGHMKRSIRILKISRSLAWVGTAVKYAIEHQLGRGRFPIRQFIGHSAVLAAATRKLIVSELNKAMRAPF